jgi:hypothetical protein
MATMQHKSFCVREFINPLNAELNPIRHLLALVGARHIVHVSRIRVKTVSATAVQRAFRLFQHSTSNEEEHLSLESPI